MKQIAFILLSLFVFVLSIGIKTDVADVVDSCCDSKESTCCEVEKSVCESECCLDSSNIVFASFEFCESQASIDFPIYCLVENKVFKFQKRIESNTCKLLASINNSNDPPPKSGKQIILSIQSILI